MSNVSLPLLSRAIRTGWRPLAVEAGHKRAAGVLLLLVLAYGLVMLLASGVPVTAVARAVRTCLLLATGAAMIPGAAYSLLLRIAPSAREEVVTRLFWLAIATILVGLTFPFYGMFKEVVLPTRGFVWDRALAHAGRLLLGVSPWTVTHRFFGSLRGTRFLDNVYLVWLPIMFTLPLFAAVLNGDPLLRFRILVSWFLAWVLIGSGAAYIFASAGPCYFNALVGPDPSYAELQRRLALLAHAAAAEGAPIMSSEFQPKLLHTYRTGGFGVGGGISAMPSMHVALAVLLAHIAWRRNAAWGLFASAYAALIWIGSVHFGWHYLVDGPVAALLITAIWQAATPFAALFYAAPPEPSSGLQRVVGELRPSMTPLQPYTVGSPHWPGQGSALALAPAAARCTADRIHLTAAHLTPCFAVSAVANLHNLHNLHDLHNLRTDHGPLVPSFERS